MKITELKIEREKRGITQEALSRKTKIALRTYKYYESGERIPDVHTEAQRIANELDSEVKNIFPLPK